MTTAAASSPPPATTTPFYTFIQQEGGEVGSFTPDGANRLTEIFKGLCTYQPFIKMIGEAGISPSSISGISTTLQPDGLLTLNVHASEADCSFPMGKLKDGTFVHQHVDKRILQTAMYYISGGENLELPNFANPAAPPPDQPPPPQPPQQAQPPQPPQPPQQAQPPQPPQQAQRQPSSQQVQRQQQAQQQSPARPLLSSSALLKLSTLRAKQDASLREGLQTQNHNRFVLFQSQDQRQAQLPAADQAITNIDKQLLSQQNVALITFHEQTEQEIQDLFNGHFHVLRTLHQDHLQAQQDHLQNQPLVAPTALIQQQQGDLKQQQQDNLTQLKGLVSQQCSRLEKISLNQAQQQSGTLPPALHTLLLDQQRGRRCLMGIHGGRTTNLFKEFHQQQIKMQLEQHQKFATQSMELLTTHAQMAVQTIARALQQTQEDAQIIQPHHHDYLLVQAVVNKAIATQQAALTAQGTITAQAAIVAQPIAEEPALVQAQEQSLTQALTTAQIQTVIVQQAKEHAMRLRGDAQQARQNAAAQNAAAAQANRRSWLPSWLLPGITNVAMAAVNTYTTARLFGVV